jgi:multicomponent Na+:H+ antiporter subunit B
VNRHELASLLFTVGLALFLAAVVRSLEFGAAPMVAGQAINAEGPAEVGAANLVTAVLLAYRGLDTLGELTILFTASVAAGLVLGHAPAGRRESRPAGFVLRTAADLLFPFLLVLGAYIILHGHLTPGGGFQGGAILAAAFFVPLLSRPGAPFHEGWAALVEGGAGAAFIVIGLAALVEGEAFLTPLLGTGELGTLFSAGTLPLLYLAVGLKVGSELAGLVARMGGMGGEHES